MLAASGELLLFSHCLPVFLVKMLWVFCSHSVHLVVPFDSAGHAQFVVWQVMELVALLSFGFDCGLLCVLCTPLAMLMYMLCLRYPACGPAAVFVVLHA